MNEMQSRGAGSFHKQAAGDLTWEVPQMLEEDFGLSLTDRDRLLLQQQQAEQQALDPSAETDDSLLQHPRSVLEMTRWEQQYAGTAQRQPSALGVLGHACYA